MPSKQTILTALARSAYDGLQSWVGRRTGRPDDSVDIAQEAFARLCGREDLAAIANPRAFLYKTASHLIIDAARQREGRAAEATADLDAIASAGPSIEVKLDIERRCDRLLEALAELPAKRRHVLLLHRFEGLCYAEIAAALGVSIRTIETHIRLALAHCRRRLAALE